jgi:hypothetical protein
MNDSDCLFYTSLRANSLIKTTTEKPLSMGVALTFTKDNSTYDETFSALYPTHPLTFKRHI